MLNDISIEKRCLTLILTKYFLRRLRSKQDLRNKVALLSTIIFVKILDLYIYKLCNISLCSYIFFFSQCISAVLIKRLLAIVRRRFASDRTLYGL